MRTIVTLLGKAIGEEATLSDYYSQMMIVMKRRRLELKAMRAM